MAKSVTIDFNANIAKFSRKIDKATDDLHKFQRNADRTSANIKKAFLQLGAGIGIAQGVKTSITVIKEFERTMSSVAAVTRATDEDMAQLTNTARELGAKTQYSATEAAEGIKFLGQAGFETNEIISALPGVLNLAAAGALELGEAADIASNVLSGFGLDAGNITEVGDVLAAVASSANTDVQQLGEAMAAVAPISAAFGISVQETAAAIGTLGNAGIQAGKAGTSLRGMFSRLGAPVKKAREALEKYGLTVDDVNPATQTLQSLLETLAAKNITAADAIAIFGQEQSAAYLAMQSGIEDFKELNKVTSEASGTMQEMSDTMTDNLQGDMDKFGSAVDELILKLGDAGLTSVLRGVVGALTDTATAFGDTATAIGGYFGEVDDTSSEDQLIAKLAVLRADLKETKSILEQKPTGPLLWGTGEVWQELTDKSVVLQAEIQRVQGYLTSLNEARITKPTEDIEKLKDELAEITGGADDAGAKAKPRSKGKSNAQREAEEFAKALRKLQDELDPVSAKTRAYMEDVALLDRAWAEGQISAEQYDLLLIQLATDTEALAKAERDLARDREKAVSFIKDLDPGSTFRDQIIEIQRLRDLFPELSDALAEAELEINDKWDKIRMGAEEAADDTRDAWQELGPVFSSAFEDASVEGEKLRDVLAGIEKDIIRIVTRNLVTQPLGNAISGMFSSGGSFDLSSIFGSIFGGARASGGPVSPGKAYLVGEEGPELVVPKSPATVLPSGAGNTYNFTFSIPTDNVNNRRTAQMVAREAARIMSTAQGAV